MSMLNLVPLTIFVLSFKYYITVRDLIGPDQRLKNFLTVLVWISCFSISVLIIQMAVYEVFLISIRWL